MPEERGCSFKKDNAANPLIFAEESNKEGIPRLRHTWLRSE